MGIQGQLEAQISEAIIKFEKEYMGRGPLEAKTYIIDDMILVRLKGVLTQAEYQLANTTEGTKGRDLIKQVRIELLEKGRPLLEAVIESITKVRVKSLHTDISTTTGERIILFTLDNLPGL
ncbi:MAG: Na-translocating system protein MpsC family protein [Sedimentisphaerales bacterium]